jgi:hypothetical protein
MMTADMIQKIEEIVSSALQKIGAEGIEKKVKLAVKFAGAQPPVEITLDGRRVTAVAVDIATVFSHEGTYFTYVDEQNVARTAESIQALSIVIVGGEVHLCKSSYDAISGSTFGDARFINCKYRTTSPEMLTENYIC